MNLKFFKQLLFILIGTMLMGFTIVNFSIRYSLADGGFSGINLIVFHTFGIEPWITNLVLNIPFVLILFKISDLKTTLMTIYGVATLTLSLAIWNQIDFILPYWGNDLFLVIVIYGVLMGIGVGIVVRANGTTGGNVLVGKLLNLKFGIPIHKTMLIFDIAVISISIFTYLTLTNAVYTLIGIYIATVVISKVQEGSLFGYKVFIISNEFERITQAVMHDLKRGATLIYATGSHSGHDNRIVMVVIQKRELGALKQLVNEIDPKSFMTVSHTYETIGEGFTYNPK